MAIGTCRCLGRIRIRCCMLGVFFVSSLVLYARTYNIFVFLFSCCLVFLSGGNSLAKEVGAIFIEKKYLVGNSSTTSSPLLPPQTNPFVVAVVSVVVLVFVVVLILVLAFIHAYWSVIIDVLRLHCFVLTFQQGNELLSLNEPRLKEMGVISC